MSRDNWTFYVLHLADNRKKSYNSLIKWTGGDWHGAVFVCAISDGFLGVDCDGGIFGE